VTDGQIIAAVISALVTIGTGGWAALKWAVTQITKAINDSTAGQKEAAKEAAEAHVQAAKAHREAAQITADAMLEQAKQFATMSTKLDTSFRWIQEHTPVEMPRMPMPLPEPPSLESESRTPTRERNPYAIPDRVDDRRSQSTYSQHKRKHKQP
jgi:hypothetical protein